MTCNWIIERDVFVIDIAEIEAGLKVVEYNTFNTAELYACDLAAVAEAVSTYVERTYKV